MAGPGTLIAVDGFDAAAVEALAAIIAAEGGPEGAPLRVSRWDASGLFADILAGRAGPADARTLTLVYAADLAFRLRWEILPLIVKGQTVIGAPYTATAVAVGRAAGLPGGWLRAALQIAPAPDVRHVTQDSGGTWAGLRGYGPLCFTAAIADTRRSEEQGFRRRVERHLRRAAPPATRQDQ